jgi:hypothetical protein
MATFSRADEQPIPVRGLDGGAGEATVRAVSLGELKSDWRGLRFVGLAEGSSIGPKPLHDVEAVCYVVSGAPTFVLPSGRTVPTHPGSCIALPLGGVLHAVNGGPGDAELLVAEVGGDPSIPSGGPNAA